MDEKDVITLLRHKRHDWMNQIQLIQGYASLNKQDRLMEQLDKMKHESDQERQLFNSGAAQFSIWLFSLNWREEQFRIQFQIKEDIDLSRYDDQLLAYCKRMIELLKDHTYDDELYEGTVYLYKGYQPDTYSLSWEWQGKFKEPVCLRNNLEKQGFIATWFEEQELSVEMTIE